MGKNLSPIDRGESSPKSVFICGSESSSPRAGEDEVGAGSPRGNTRPASARSLLDLHVHATGGQRDAHPLRGRDQIDGDTILVFHRRDAAATADRRTGAGRRVVAVEIAEVLEVVDLPGCRRLGDADGADREPIHLYRIALPLVGQRAASPAETDTGGHGSALQ